MTCFICQTCGVQHAAGHAPPPHCRICEDERQYVGWQGQRWTTLDELCHEGFRSEVRDLEPRLAGIGTTPSLAIGQRALLVQTEHGNVLWDCPGYLDEQAVERVRELGGLAGISASHPHFYGCMVEWSRGMWRQHTLSHRRIRFRVPMSRRFAQAHGIPGSTSGCRLAVLGHDPTSILHPGIASRMQTSGFRT